ncbi:MAG: type IV pilin protein [Halioglobus sp.]
MPRKATKARGFTLIELVMVVLVVSILLTVALPAYQNQVIKTKRSLARGELLEVLARQEQYFVNNKAYATKLTYLGYPADGYYVDGNGNDFAAEAESIYQVRFYGIPGTANFTLEAVPQGVQGRDFQCGILRITSTGLKATSTSKTEECW